MTQDSKTTIRYGIGSSAIGLVLVAASGEGICAILLGDDADDLVGNLSVHFPTAEFELDSGLVTMAAALLDSPVELPRKIEGTAFQRRVWEALREIPPGQTASYGEIAKRIGAPRALRAVARACAANRLAIAIPCHRVIRGDGSLSGYRWGVARKKALQGLEKGLQRRDLARHRQRLP